MTVSQGSFRSALLDAGEPVPAGLTDASGAPAEARFSVYRNNVIVSLTEAMTTAFPLVRKLLGGETFSKLSAVYVRTNPPTSPLMMFYGASLPSFLERFEPLMHIGYLPDCARLDLAMRRSYHAADSTHFDPAVLQNPDNGLDLIVTLAPATRILTSPWPLFDIWKFNMVAGASKPQPVAQDVLITRPEFDPMPHLLPIGARRWFKHLDSGAPLAEATERTLVEEPAFDLTQTLTLALSSNALAKDTTKETE